MRLRSYSFYPIEAIDLIAGIISPKSVRAFSTIKEGGGTTNRSTRQSFIQAFNRSVKTIDDIPSMLLFNTLILQVQSY